ncbi:GIY-YIG nuclease family protein [Wenyingzhuangia aestuarii]|uniref:GIY-YIG nuclease family protein n=1 Tax=Wenyingzhuangia aestuarii TaxID=1647582 RepID=UPI001439CF38|nr:GIY-YIG nuclease family protein [Wenyingzhuangia aestuarii]NJB81690.1 putative GIY-YIG superfamily endonuclease [Wenyingzhuangia aestuarii]
MFYYVYILKCSDDSFYTGITNNISRRLEEHQSAKCYNSYTSKRLPIKLVWVQEFTNPELAIAKEKQLKGWSRRKKQALIDEDYDQLILFSQNSPRQARMDNTDNNQSSTSSD